jgi:hypothetical protein
VHFVDNICIVTYGGVVFREDFFVLASLLSEAVMARKKISTTVYITQEQSEQLKLLNRKTKVPVAEYIREGIDLVLQKHKHLLPGQISFVDKG